jgi:predicted transporter
MLDLIELLGIIMTILVFGAMIGITIWFTDASKKFLVVINIFCGIGMFILAYISLYFDTIYKAIIGCSSIIFLVISFIMLVTGLTAVKIWKIHPENSKKLRQLFLGTLFPCCWGAVLTTTVLIYPLKEVSITYISLMTAIFLSVTILTFYFASGTIIRTTKICWPVSLANSMFFIGFCYLISAIAVPNITSIFKSQMSPMSAPSVEILIYTVIGTIILVFIGFYLSKKRSFLIQK